MRRKLSVLDVEGRGNNGVELKVNFPVQSSARGGGLCCRKLIEK